ncbi:MAG: ubiquinol-cytochrome c reductase iron-sulfur subunit [Bacteroidetes bacterium]|nr:ubiquinol-cytochrome c reductase iron-sulfur subunit [Bacteroidota bacterium]
MANTEEPQQPEQIDPSRRSFLKISSNAIAGFATLILAIPFLDALISPSLRIKIGEFVKVGPVSVLSDGDPQKVFFDERAKDAYIEETERRDVWAIRNGSKDVTVFSPICPHLGCRYNWDPASEHFACPCHGSVWSKDGKILRGPTPRPLDTLPHKIEGDELYVKWERFKLGVPKKIVI